MGEWMMRMDQGPRGACRVVDSLSELEEYLR